jgi:GTP-binding protein LepA
MVFAGIYTDDNTTEDLEKAIERIMLTDGSITFHIETSSALGSGFRCGFLGLLHLDVFK